MSDNTLNRVTAIMTHWGAAAIGALLSVAGLAAIGIGHLNRLGGTALALGVALIATWLVLSRRQSRSVEAQRDATRARLTSWREGFEDAAKKATAYGETAPQAALDTVRAGFAELEARLSQATSQDLETLEDRAIELAAFRACVAPRVMLPLMAAEVISDLRDWGVPADVLADIKDTLLKPQTVSDAESRAALQMLLREHADWDVYVTWYNGFLGNVTAVLFTTLLVALVAGILALVEHIATLGLLLIGIAGALVSILAKLPSVSNYATTNSWIFHIVSRIATGLAGALIGWGLLSSTIVSIGLPATKGIDQIIMGCSGADVTVPCDAPQLLILVAIGLLFGFSERALATFEGRVFPSVSGAGGTSGAGAPATPSPNPAAPAAPAGVRP
jgi:hypothetical protein